MLEHNPNLDRWGNTMEFINGVAAGAVNPFLSAGEAVGVGDALYGTGYAIDKATMYGIAPLSADGKWSAIEKLDRLAGVEKDIVNAVRDWSAENPNAAETVEAAFNVAAVTKAANLAKTGAGKATVSDNFSDAYRAGRNQAATVANSQVGYEAAKRGGKHSGFYKNNINRSSQELQKGVHSLEKQIKEHERLIKNPEKTMRELNKGDWTKLDPRQQEALITKKWPSDIARQKEQKSILEGILKERGM